MNKSILLWISLILIGTPLYSEDKRVSEVGTFQIIDTPDVVAFCVYLSRPASRFLGWDSQYFYLSKPQVTENELRLDQEIPFGFVVRLPRDRITKEQLRVALEHKVLCIGHEVIRQTPPTEEYNIWCKGTPRNGEIVINSLNKAGIQKLVAEAFPESKEK